MGVGQEGDGGEAEGGDHKGCGGGFAEALEACQFLHACGQRVEVEGPQEKRLGIGCPIKAAERDILDQWIDGPMQ